MSAQPRILNGADATRAADKLRRANERRAAWPYAHLEPPPDAIPVNQIGAPVDVGVAGVPTLVFSYLVPANFRFVMQGIIQGIGGGGFMTAFNPGDSFWTVTVNPQNGVQANPVQGLIQTPVPLGNWEFGTWWRFPMPYVFAGLDLVSSVATNVNLNAGPPNSYVTGFLGYLIQG